MVRTVASAVQDARLIRALGSRHRQEEPGKVLLSLVQYARPFAERVGDIPR
jgi:hypothetical protein